ncbi:MAG: 50S ribosomal protein L22 [Egibacteraceae bacterium]
MQYRATAKYVHATPSKLRQVVAHIRGVSVLDAQRLLQFSPKGVAPQILKTLNSAVANANHADESLHADDLIVAAAVVEEGPTLKRFQPRAKGRAYKVRKRTSHITIAVERHPHVATATGRGRRGWRSGRGGTGVGGQGRQQSREG